MIASVQLVDVGPVDAIRSLLVRPKPTEVRGLRFAQVALLVPLAFSGPPPISRAGLLAFWDDDDAADRFERTHAIARRFSGGFRARLRPLRAHGSWPGLPADVPATRAVPHDRPVMVLTLGLLRISQTVRFLRTSRPAERTATRHDGMIWGTAAVRPPFVSTISVWRSTQATTAYAYGRLQPAHSEAIAEQQRQDFHRQSAFIRFAPTRLEGSLAGSNPLPASAIAPLQPATGEPT